MFSQNYVSDPIENSVKPLTSSKHYYKQNSNIWNFWSESFFTWDSLYEKVLEINTYFSDTTKIVNTYNSNNHITSKLKSVWDESTQTWKPLEDIYNQYNSNCPSIPYYKVYMNYNEMTSQWDSTFKVMNTFDNNCQYNTTVSQQFVNGNWENGEKFKLEFNNNNQRTVETRFLWSNNQWLEYRWDTIYYNALNQIDNQQVYIFDILDNTKKTYYKREYMYDANNILLEDISYFGAYAYPNQNWTFRRKTTYSMNQGQLTNVDVDFWNISSNTWQEYRIYGYGYDLENDLLWDTLSNPPTGQVQKTEYFYAFPTDVKNVSSTKNTLSCITSNPYSFGTPISCNDLKIGKTYTVKLYNLIGELVYSKQINGNPSFSIPYHPNITKGMYILTVSDGDKQYYTNKLMIGM